MFFQGNESPGERRNIRKQACGSRTAFLRLVSLSQTPLLAFLLAAVPVAGAALDAAENALQFAMMLSRPTDELARIAFTISNAKWVALYVGLGLWLGAVLARQQERQTRRLKES